MIQTTPVWEVPPLSSTVRPTPHPRYIPSFLSIAWMQEGNHKTEARQFKQACHMLLNSNVLPAIPPVLQSSPLDEKAAPANLPVTARIRARGWPSAGVFPLFSPPIKGIPSRLSPIPLSPALLPTCVLPRRLICCNYSQLSSPCQHPPHVPMR